MIHIAGFDIRIGNYLRQRCAWCGTTLVDYDLTRVAVPDDQPGDPGTWPTGALVHVNGHISFTVDHDPGADILPPNACYWTDPAVTA